MLQRSLLNEVTWSSLHLMPLVPAIVDWTVIPVDLPSLDFQKIFFLVLFLTLLLISQVSYTRPFSWSPFNASHCPLLTALKYFLLKHTKIISYLSTFADDIFPDTSYAFSKEFQTTVLQPLATASQYILIIIVIQHKLEYIFKYLLPSPHWELFWDRLQHLTHFSILSATFLSSWTGHRRLPT